MDIIEKYNIDTTKLKRDYLKQPLNKITINTPTGYCYEKPFVEDVKYLYIDCNVSKKRFICIF